MTANPTNLPKTRGFQDKQENSSFNYEEKPLEKWSLLGDSESNESSQNSRKSPCIKITEHEEVKEITLPLTPKTVTRTAEEWHVLQIR